MVTVPGCECSVSAASAAVGKNRRLSFSASRVRRMIWPSCAFGIGQKSLPHIIAVWTFRSVCTGIRKMSEKSPVSTSAVRRLFNADDSLNDKSRLIVVSHRVPGAELANSEWIEFNYVPLDTCNRLGHVGDESFQASDCTIVGTDSKVAANENER